jgi:predicted RNase H-like HicB family nuclease
MKLMLRLRLKNRIPENLVHHAPFPYLHPEFPLKSKVERGTGRQFQVISLPQKDGSFVASVLEAPTIRVYDRSRKAAEKKATQRFLKTPDRLAYKRHPLATSKVVTIDMEYDLDADAFVTYVKELHGMSTFGETESAALDNTAEMIRGYIRSMEANRRKIPLSPSKLAELKRQVDFA